jgi:hypothetical protein
MIDPKFNELPVDAEGEFVETPAASLAEEQGQRTARQGLSINDTVAANANLSVGSRGVDTSGSSAGSGAGAGMTMTTPGDEVTPAPMIAPGARGSGTTVRGDSASQLAPGTESDSSTVIDSTPEPSPTTRLEAGTENTGTHLLGTDEFSISEISERAYHCWIDRGSPHGSPEVDWATAVEQLRREKRSAIAATA